MILADLDESNVIKIRKRAQGQETVAWRVKMSCDVSLVNRDHAKRGRGNVDIFCQGVKAAVRQRAKELSCGTSTIWLNLRIFKTFFQNGISEYTILEDKGFYQAALRAPSPLIAIRTFSRYRRKNGADFKVNDAFRWANRKLQQVKFRQRYGRVKRSTLIPFLEADLAKLLDMKRQFPNEKLAARLFDPMIETIREQITDVLETSATEWLRKICESEPYRAFSERDLASITGLTPGNVRYYMNQLEDERAVYQVRDTSSWRVPERIRIEA